MNSRYQSHLEVLQILETYGPLTYSAIVNLRKLSKKVEVMRWMVLNEYIGIRPTVPVTYVSMKKPLPQEGWSPTMQGILDQLEQLGPCSALAIAHVIGKTQGHVDHYLRAAAELDLCHRSGKIASTERPDVDVYAWTFGAGEAFVKQKVTKHRAAPKPVKVVPEPVVRRDPFIEALFGRAA